MNDHRDLLIRTSWIGWHVAGHVDRFGRETIATEFYHVIIPIVPRPYSLYICRDRDGAEVCFPIPRDRRSMWLGLFRTPVWLAATILGSGGIATDNWAAISIALALAIVGAVLTFMLGALEPGERDRRALLYRVTGLGAPPELLRASAREDTRDALAGAWFREHRTDWRSSIMDGVADERLVALADYDRAPQLVIRARTNLIDAEGN